MGPWACVVRVRGVVSWTVWETLGGCRGMSRLLSAVPDGEMGSMLSSSGVVKLGLLVMCVLGEGFSPVPAVSRESVDAECSVGLTMGRAGW